LEAPETSEAEILRLPRSGLKLILASARCLVRLLMPVDADEGRTGWATAGVFQETSATRAGG